MLDFLFIITYSFKDFSIIIYTKTQERFNKIFKLLSYTGIILYRTTTKRDKNLITSNLNKECRTRLPVGWQGTLDDKVFFK